MGNRTANSIPKRGELKPEDTWDLSSLYTSEADWERDIKKAASYIEKADTFAGTLRSGGSMQIRKLMDFLNEIGLLIERSGHYAFLKYAEDAGNSENQARLGRITQLETELSAALSYVEPELLSIPEDEMKEILASEELSEFSIRLKKILRFKPYVLSKEEERVLALQSDAAETPQNAFEALSNVDMQFGTIETPDGEKPLSQSSLSSFLQNNDRNIRSAAYKQFYKIFDGHKNTLSALYAGSVKQDVYQAKVRGYPSSRAKALYPDNVPEHVYDNLISVIHEFLPALHEYYSFRKSVMGLKELRHYDVYVPLVDTIETHYSYDEAVDTVNRALAPLGSEYTEILRNGLLGTWVDKYENQVKRSGAFSAGSYAGDPYILMNYKEDVLRDMFTLAHEGGHSMHSWYSVHNNPFQHYHYTIFEAEAASTFNEQLLADYLLKHAESDEMKAYIISKQIDDIIATIFRQTMFAEFESKTHASVEAGQPLTAELLRSMYRDLLTSYFGPEMVFEPESDLEGLRIPHFYRAFYVYKYATGLSAAIALSKQVLEGDESDRSRYIRFLKSGGSKFPIDSLKDAGVDMSSPDTVRSALGLFSQRVETLKEMFKNKTQ